MSPFFQRLTNKVAMPTYTPSHHEGGTGGGKERREREEDLTNPNIFPTRKTAATYSTVSSFCLKG